MKPENRLKALELIEEKQGGDHTNGTSSVTVRIGGTQSDGMIEHDSLYVIDACTAVLETLTDHGFKLSVSPDGIRVSDHALE